VALPTAISVIVTIILSTGVFSELQAALNTIWRLEPSDQGLWVTVRDRFFSFILVIGIGFLMVVSLLMSAAMAAFGSFLTHLVGAPEFLLELIDGVISLSLFGLLFAMMFKMLPNARLAWRDVWIGAIATTVLFTVGNYGIGLYLGKRALPSLWYRFLARSDFAVGILFSAYFLIRCRIHLCLCQRTRVTYPGGNRRRGQSGEHAPAVVLSTRG
jgi:membrane protein